MSWRGRARPSYSEPVSGAEPRLEWGRLAAFNLARAERMSADLVRAWQVAQESLGLVLRLARAVFPEIRPWTEDIVDAHYDPRTKLLAAIYGQPQRRAQWP